MYITFKMNRFSGKTKKSEKIIQRNEISVFLFETIIGLDLVRVVVIQKMIFFYLKKINISPNRVNNRSQKKNKKQIHKKNYDNLRMLRFDAFNLFFFEMIWIFHSLFDKIQKMFLVHIKAILYTLIHGKKKFITNEERTTKKKFFCRSLQ